MNSKLGNLNKFDQTHLVFDLNPYYGILKLQGKETLGFLQGLLTCDMQELQNKNHCFGALCNIKGRVLALFRIFKHKEDLYLVFPKELMPGIMPVIKKPALFSKITLSDVSQDWSLWGSLGGRTNLASVRLFIDNALARCMDIFEINDPTHFDQSHILNAYGPNFLQADFLLWKSLDIQAGIPEIWKQTTGKFLPHHLNLPALGAVSFTKGCYCGQEIVARMEYQGKIKYHLEKIHTSLSSKMNSTSEINSFPEPGDELYYDSDGSLRYIKEKRDPNLDVPSEHIMTVITAGSSEAEKVDLLVLKSISSSL